MPRISLQIDRDLPNECMFVDNLIHTSLKTGLITQLLRTVLVAHCAGIPFSLAGRGSYIFDPEAIFHAIRVLEGFPTKDTTKGPFQFESGPLKGLWKKHFFQASFIPQNLLASSERSRNGGIERMYKALNLRYGKGKWIGKQFDQEDAELISQTFVGDALEQRAASRSRSRNFGLTGEHLIFERGPKKNRYLYVASHTDDHGKISEMIRGEVSLS